MIAPATPPHIGTGEKRLCESLGVKDPEKGLTPKWIRLPRFGGRCPYTHLTRTQLDHLTRPQKWNRFNPPVESKILRIDGGEMSRGARLINFASLMAYLEALPSEADATANRPKSRGRVKEAA